MRERWLENYQIQRDKALWSTPFLIRMIVGLFVYRKTSQTLYGQGTGRYSSKEIAAFRREIWQALNDRLESSLVESKSSHEGKEPFWILGGATPTEADATLFGFVTSVLVSHR